VEAIDPRPLSQVTTSEMPVVRRSTVELPPEAFVLASSTPNDNALRRTRGSLIALVLLLLFLGGALWWVYRTAEQVVAPPPATAPTPADARP
jgi:hypothetical protein